MPPSILWANVFVDELARNGLQAVVIAPGSRSTPLTLAFAADARIRVYSLIDERGAAFFALGLAMASHQPVALVCTSGTATANFFPAVIEAWLSHVPLLVLTADRPQELRDSGANQTINQVNLYGSHVRWFVDVALPEEKPADLTVRYLRTTACRAMETAVGLPPGPVHLNFPFRKPLEPTSPESLPAIAKAATLGGRSHTSAPFTRMSRGKLLPDEAQIVHLTETIRRHQRGVILCGPRCAGGAFPQAVVQLAQAAHYPILADATSGVRFGPQVTEVVLGGYNHYLAAWQEPPDLILRFGAMPTTKGLLDWVERAEAWHIVVSEDGVWEDAAHRANEWLWLDSAVLCQKVREGLLASTTSEKVSPLADFVINTPTTPNWLSLWQTAESATWGAITQRRAETFSEGMILAEVVESLPDGAGLFVSSSLPVRHLDQWARPSQKRLRLFANRGASGIDGTVSTALGVAAVCQPLLLVTGDLAFYHDLNGLLALQRCGVTATILVINNNGGGIFRHLPIAQFEPPFTELFHTPHHLQFESAARLFGLDYFRVTNVIELRQQLRLAGSRLIEFIFNDSS